MQIAASGGGGARKLAGALAGALAGSGAKIRRRRLPGSETGSWLVATKPGAIRGRPELVVVPDDPSRGTVERERPDLVGDVWVWEGEDDRLPGRLLSRYRPNRTGPAVKLGVIGYNLKFFRPIEAHLRRLPGVDTRIAEWPKYAVNAPAATDSVLDWADVIMCEWAGPNAALASRHKRPGQRLVVRFHRFELERDDWRDISITEVDTIVTVGTYYRRRLLEVTGWPEERIMVVPNLVDIDQFDRPKLPKADRTIGLLGGSPWRKRPDRALDVLERLAEHDEGWRLRIKGFRPEEERWIWEDADHRKRFETLYRRIDRLGKGVSWDEAGPDVAEWFRSVGHILSPSDDESFHLAPAEGMASGTTPTIWPWPGADEIYPPRWMVADTDSAVAAITSRETSDRLAAREGVEAWRREAVLAQWERILLPDR